MLKVLGNICKCGEIGVASRPKVSDEETMLPPSPNGTYTGSLSPPSSPGAPSLPSSNGSHESPPEVIRLSTQQLGQAPPLHPKLCAKRSSSRTREDNASAVRTENRILSESCDVRRYLIDRKRLLTQQNDTSVMEEKDTIIRLITILEALQSDYERLCQELGDLNHTREILEDRTASQENEIETLKNESTQRAKDLAEASKTVAHLSKELERNRSSRTSRHFRSMKKFSSAADMAKLKFSMTEEVLVQSPMDENSCRITGCVLVTPTTMAVADCNNSAVKIVDIQNNSIVRYFRLCAAPWDVTILPNDEIAVTLQLKKFVQIIALDSRNQEVFLKVDGDCRGIDYVHKLRALVITFVDPEKVELIDLQGTPLKTFSFHNGEAMFLRPHYVCCSNTEDLVFVSDTLKNTVTKLSLAGEVLGVYSDREMTEPEGVCSTSDGGFLVSSYSKNLIQLVSKNFEKIENILTDMDGIEGVQTMHFDLKNCKIYVALYKNNVKVFSPSGK
ncbi:uncharacterized protein LOC128243399 [Mya arenaria]|uniref:uncharacterized protein LOC128243399 n=1 Tax=Mya arenaria TaxID=6604 RepID=UPI0022E37EC7|nr:uncharacterized protein LOC128243399 [Mya arenaria]